MSFLLREQTPAMLGPAGFLAVVVSVKDPQSRNRVQVRVYPTDGVADQDGPVWARVAVPFAGNNRGAFFLPDVGDEVLVVFLSGDSRYPVVVGSMWNGHDAAPEKLGGAGDQVDRWTITGKAGTRIAIVEQGGAGNATIQFSTPGGLTGKMSDADGSIEFSNSAQSKVVIDSQGISLSTSAKVQISASEVDVTAATVNVSAATSTFSGIVNCQTLQATTVVATTYTPGAGNVW